MTETDQLYTGRRLGRYELLVPIAEGATAQVWAARMTGSRLEKIVAVKVLSSDLTSDVDAESMFLDEARLISRIRHPNVAAVLDFAEEGELLYIVIEWIEGEPLQVVLREVARSEAHRMPLPLAIRVVKLAASGLHAAHELCDDAGKPVGLVHRDVSPGNLMVGYEGVVKVIDFGVAKAASNMQQTRVGQIKGKVAYMAPEQTSGDRVDRRTDVFALGVVLYQLVTGKHPFRGDNEFATMARIRDKNPADPPRVHVPDLPPALEEVMLRALAKPRNERFETMLDFGRGPGGRRSPPPPDVDRTLRRLHGIRALHSASPSATPPSARPSAPSATGPRPCPSTPSTSPSSRSRSNRRASAPSGIYSTRSSWPAPPPPPPRPAAPPASAPGRGAAPASVPPAPTSIPETLPEGSAASLALARPQDRRGDRRRDPPRARALGRRRRILRLLGRPGAHPARLLINDGGTPIPRSGLILDARWTALFPPRPARGTRTP